MCWSPSPQGLASPVPLPGLPSRTQAGLPGPLPFKPGWVSWTGSVPVTAGHLGYRPWLLDREHVEGPPSPVPLKSFKLTWRAGAGGWDPGEGEAGGPRAQCPPRPPQYPGTTGPSPLRCRLPPPPEAPHGQAAPRAPRGRQSRPKQEARAGGALPQERSIASPREGGQGLLLASRPLPGLPRGSQACQRASRALTAALLCPCLWVSGDDSAGCSWGPQLPPGAHQAAQALGHHQGADGVGDSSSLLLSRTLPPSITFDKDTPHPGDTGLSSPTQAF